MQTEPDRNKINRRIDAASKMAAGAVGAAVSLSILFFAFPFALPFLFFMIWVCLVAPALEFGQRMTMYTQSPLIAGIDKSGCTELSARVQLENPAGSPGGQLLNKVRKQRFNDHSQWQREPRFTHAFSRQWRTGDKFMGGETWIWLVRWSIDDKDRITRIEGCFSKSPDN